VDGVISDRLVSPGAFVSPQTPVVTLVPPALEVVVNVEERNLGQVHVGEPVQLQVPAFATRTFAAHVESIAPTLDAKSRTAAVHIHPQDPDGALRAGMFAQLSIISAQKHDALLVPNAALISADNHPRVVAIDSENTAHLQPVQLGIQDGAFTEILSGVNDGDLVATSGLSDIHDGQVVAPQTDTLNASVPAAAY
jgi:RND family efflux transporter MFP subunit